MSSLVVTVDALRADHLGQFGYDRNTFPVADQLAASGTTFTRAFANGTNTGVSLPSLLTSQYRGTDAATDGQTVATAIPSTVTTVGVHSNTYFATRVSGSVGFDVFEDFDILANGESRDRSTIKSFVDSITEKIKPVVDTLGIREFAENVQERVFPASVIHNLTPYENAAQTTDRTLELLSAVDGEFFAWVHYMDPHRPYGIDLEDPAYTDPVDEQEIRRLMGKAAFHPEDVTPSEHRQIVDLYDSDVRYTSRHIGRLFDGLRDRGLWTDTDVVLTADHGEEFADHGFYYHRNRPYDELIHVPLFVRRATEGDNSGDGETGAVEVDAENHSGDVVEEQRELLDIAPTVCSFHSVTPPEAFAGTDLFTGTPRTVVATGSFRDDGPVVGVRTEKWKYIEHSGGRELYDIREDPSEKTSIAEDDPSQCRRLEKRVPEAARDTGEDGQPGPESVSSEAAERLQQLGYAE